MAIDLVATIRGEQLTIERRIAIVKKRAQPAITALGDVVRMTGHDDAVKTGHAAS